MFFFWFVHREREREREREKVVDGKIFANRLPNLSLFFVLFCNTFVITRLSYHLTYMFFFGSFTERERERERERKSYHCRYLFCEDVKMSKKSWWKYTLLKFFLVLCTCTISHKLSRFKFLVFESQNGWRWSSDNVLVVQSVLFHNVHCGMGILLYLVQAQVSVVKK